VKILRVISLELAYNPHVRAEQRDSEPQAHGGAFATTHWSVVLAAGAQHGSKAAEALEQLCRTYWHPLYVYVRRSGYRPEDAADLTQEFLSRFLEKGAISVADPARGRFRTFLLTSLQHFLADDWKRAHRAKRGGGAIKLPLDRLLAEEQCEPGLANYVTPERAYEERWAMILLEHVLAEMHAEHARLGKVELFEALQDLLWGPDVSLSYSTLAQKLGMTEMAIRAAVHRLREKFRARLRTEVAHTVSDAGEVDTELRYLLNVITGRM
jgi:RNA polymerase sigma factor (sigma-70 family)